MTANAPLAYTRKVPQAPPEWVEPFLAAVTNEGLDQATPSRRARLVADELLPPSLNRETWLHRFAAALDLNPILLYRLERMVSPLGPIEAVADHIADRVARVVRGGVA